MAKIWNREEKAEVEGVAATADPLSEVTRRERRLLLVVSVILFAVAFGGLLPTEIDALGIGLTTNETSRLLLLGSAIQTYLVVAFWLYSTADLKAWAMERERLFRDSSNAQAKLHTNLEPQPGQDEEAFEEWLYEKQSEFVTLFRAELHKHFRVLSWRAFFERWVAILIGVVALAATLFRMVQSL